MILPDGILICAVSELESIEINLTVGPRYVLLSDGRCHKLLSAVTKYLVFDRMPGLKVKLEKWRQEGFASTVQKSF